MNPYEKTAAAMKSQSEGPKRALKAGASIVGAAGGLKAAASFAPMLQKAAPFLSEYIPENLALKGLSKISPGFGKFISGAIGSGYDFSEIKDFIGDQINESQKDQALPEKDGKNIIQKYSPELFQEISDLIQKGNAPIQAGAHAHKKHKKIIQQIEKDYNADWLDIVESIFGKGDIAGQGMQAQQQSQIAQEVMNPPGSMPTRAPSAELQAFGGQQQMQAQPQQGGSGNARLLQMLQGINQRLGGK